MHHFTRYSAYPLLIAALGLAACAQNGAQDSAARPASFAQLDLDGDGRLDRQEAAQSPFLHKCVAMLSKCDGTSKSPSHPALATGVCAPAALRPLADGTAHSHKWLNGVSVALAHTAAPDAAGPYAYRGLPALASLSMAGSGGGSQAPIAIATAPSIRRSSARSRPIRGLSPGGRTDRSARGCDTTRPVGRLAHVTPPHGNPLILDGAAGEGGGQILRSALTLSMLTGRAFRLINLRARRPRPGLMPQHLTAVQAAAAVTGAAIEGAELGSGTLTFAPGAPNPGEYRFDIGTAGSTALLAQTLTPALAMQPRPSLLTLTGGTHVPWSPCYHFLAWQWLPYLTRIGFNVTMRLERAGYFPRGGGVMAVRIDPPSPLRPLKLEGRGRLLAIEGLSAVTHLSDRIAHRQRLQAERELVAYSDMVRISEGRLEGVGQGSVVVLIGYCENGSGCHFALGAPGKPAERVAAEATRGLLSYFRSSAAVDRFLADQLLLPLALVPGDSTFTTERVTGHLRTNAVVIEAFLPMQRWRLEEADAGAARVVRESAGPH